MPTWGWVRSPSLAPAPVDHFASGRFLRRRSVALRWRCGPHPAPPFTEAGDAGLPARRRRVGDRAPVFQLICLRASASWASGALFGETSLALDDEIVNRDPFGRGRGSGRCDIIEGLTLKGRNRWSRRSAEQPHFATKHPRTIWRRKVRDSGFLARFRAGASRSSAELRSATMMPGLSVITTGEIVRWSTPPHEPAISG